MPLSWNEIRNRAIQFSQEYKDVTRENAETHSFYNAFFEIFGIKRSRVASFEAPVKMLGTRRGRIDLFWKGTLLVEHKSSGKDLGVARTQALDYFPNLKEEELPRYILVSDFQHFELVDLEANVEYKFSLAELHQHVELFGFIAGYQKRVFRDQDPVNIEASERMGKLHDMLKDSGYTDHDLEQYLVRLLFCLFADDTNIFEKDSLRFYIEEHTKEDGSDLGSRLSDLFQTLNTPREKRYKTLDESLAQFPYVNGNLFAERLPNPAFNRTMREILLSACFFDWGRISPAIFGSLFQSVMDKERRRGIGAHYTTEKNILKILKPLFLDGLYEEFQSLRYEPRKLQNFHKKLQTLTFLDPACGCGNFLILAYRELRLLEIEVLKALYPTGQQAFDVAELSRINVDAFYGIEIEEFPARIAEVALWLMDHQMNIRLSETFGQYYTRIPLQAAAHIHHANALQLDWETVVPKERLSYILGNPPFVGAMIMNEAQRQDIEHVFKDTIRNAGVLDYVTAWYFKAVKYMGEAHSIRTAFVSTNSITQGEQASILWQQLLNEGVKIHFAHRTFAWSSEARGKAAVHCVIVGFGLEDCTRKIIYDYQDIKADPHAVEVKNINPYLVDAPNVVVVNRTTPLCNVPAMRFGSMPRDGGHLIFTDEEKDAFLALEPEAESWLRPYTGAQEFINGWRRWCLWLTNISPNELRQLPRVMERVMEVRAFRLASKAATTRKFAQTPAVFCQIAQPDSDYLLVPRVSSERRHYIPIGFLPAQVIANDQVLTVEYATHYHFGVMSSEMHMEWTRYVCGRLKSDYRYSKDIVYNNFPWPQNPTPQQVQAIETKAQAVLDARAQFPKSTLADLYDPLSMPPALSKAHQALDKAVDVTYRKQPFETERSRVEFLFGLYQQLTDPLITAITKTSRKRKIN
ncbi:MAG: DNA methyltransferase [Chloroflexota bacterium]